MTKLALMEDCIPYSPTLGAIFGCCGALLIQQVHYWCRVNERENKNFRDGYYWTYNTYKQWEDAFRDWEERTIRRQVAELVAVKVLVLGRYNRVKYDKTNWYRVDYSELNKITAKHGLDKMTSPSGQFDHSDTVKMSAPIPESKEETKAKTSLASPEPTPQQELIDTSEENVMLKKIPKPVERKGPTSSGKIQTLLSPKTADLKDVTAMGMYKIWATTVPQFNEGVKFVAPFNMKQKGQMNMLVKLWDGHDPGTVLEYVLSHWVKFGKYVTVQTGIKTYPEAPSTDFLMKYGDAAMNFFLAKAVAKDIGLCAIQGALAVVEFAANCNDKPKPLGKIIFKKAGAAQTLDAPVAALVENTQLPVLSPLVPAEEDDDKPITYEELLATYGAGKYNGAKK